MAVCHRPGQQGTTKLSGIGSEHRAVEEEPDVCSVSRPRALDGCWNLKSLACRSKSRGVCHPRRLVEIHSEKPTGFVGKKRVNADGLFPSEVIADCAIGERLKHPRLPCNLLSFFRSCRVNRVPVHYSS